jgi:hypothetical protein
LGLFEIKEIKGLVNYKLKLPNNIRIYLIFYILLLELILAGVPKALYTEIDLVNPNAVYNIEEILDCQLVNKILKYLVKWLDYLYSENIWESKTNLSCSKKLTEFHR